MFGPAPDADGDWLPALSPDELTDGGHDNLTAPGIERIDVVNLRIPDAGRSAARRRGRRSSS
jgi:pyridoxine 4-dehydrogenase